MMCDLNTYSRDFPPDAESYRLSTFRGNDTAFSTSSDCHFYSTIVDTCLASCIFFLLDLIFVEDGTRGVEPRIR